MSRFNQKERGQTIVLVALTVVTMLAMAALAIDVVTLYVARTECIGLRMALLSLRPGLSLIRG